MEHIKITDLSIGDWVMYDLQPYMIVSIDGESHHVIISGSDGWRDKHIDYIEPICISRKFLELNGAEYIEIDEDEGSGFYYVDGIKPILNYSNSKYAFSFEAGLPDICQLKYVHQLQHIYRLLGIDKEITL
jgi:hypothetical protein